jgi:hypothetical protein
MHIPFVLHLENQNQNHFTSHLLQEYPYHCAFLDAQKQGGISEGEAAELNAPLLSGYLEPGKQPYSFSRDWAQRERVSM